MAHVPYTSEFSGVVLLVAEAESSEAFVELLVQKLDLLETQMDGS